MYHQRHASPTPNTAYMELHKLCAAKYVLLSTPSASVRSLPDGDRKRHAAFKALEGEATKGVYFVSEEDLKQTSHIRNDATGKNLLAVLRHVGRLKEFKHSGGLRCYQVKGSNTL